MTKTEQWRLHLQQWTTSGLSAEAFAERNALSPRALKWWRWKIGTVDAKAGTPKASTKAVFAEVVVAPARPASGFELLLPNACVVRVAVDFDEDALRRLLRVLR